MDFTSMPIVALGAGTTVRLSGANAAIAQLSTLRNVTGTLILENGKTLATSGNMVIPGVLQFGLPADTGTTKLAVTGNMDFTGTRVDIHDLGLTSGTYTLATWSGTVTGVPTLGARPPWSRHTLVVDSAAKALKLEVVTGFPPVVSGIGVVAGTGANSGRDVVTITATGTPDMMYKMEISTDLEVWTPEGAPVGSPTGQLLWEFTQPAGLSRLFVRFALP